LSNTDLHSYAGVKKDEEKPRFDLIPVLPLLGVAEVFAEGALKYSERNWEQGLAFHRVYRAAIGHLVAWWNGEDADAEWGFSHLDHALCCILMLSEYAHRPDQFKMFDDRPYTTEGRHLASGTDTAG
jgi:hypothetical protein